MKRGTHIVLMAAALALVVLFGCGKKGPEPIKITVGQGTDPVILDPPMYSDTPTHNLNLVIYDRLYELTKDGRVEPNLAVDLPKVEENGTKYTIKIRDGVKFHNGNKLAIDDVLFSFQRGAFHEKSQMK